MWDCALCAAYPKQSSGRPHSSRGWIQLSPAVVRSTRFFHWDNYNELKTSLLFITVSVQKMPAIVCHLYCILLAFFWKIITNMHRTYIKSCWRCEQLTFDSAATHCLWLDMPWQNRRKTKFDNNLVLLFTISRIQQRKSIFRDITWNAAGKTWYYAEYVM